MKLLAKFISLPAMERRLLIRAALLLGAVRLGISLLSFRTVRRMIARQSSNVAPHHQESDNNLAVKVGWSVQLASRYIPAATCLSQALAAIVLLRQLGQPACLRLGVEKSAAGRLEAHAWVESGGQIVIGKLANLSRYTLLSPPEKLNRDERNLRHPAS